MNDTLHDSKDNVIERPSRCIFANWKRDEISVSGRSSRKKKVERAYGLITKKTPRKEDKMKT